MYDLSTILPSNALQELYARNRCVKVLILSFKRVGPKIFRMKVQDLNHWNNFFVKKNNLCRD